MSNEPGRLTRIPARQPAATDPANSGSSSGLRKLAFVTLAAGGLYLAADHFGLVDRAKNGITGAYEDAKIALKPANERVKLDLLFADFGTRYRVTAPGGTCLYTPDDLRRYSDLCHDYGTIISGFVPKRDNRDKAHNGEWLYTQRLVFGQMNEFYLPLKDVTRIDVFGNAITEKPKQPAGPSSPFVQYADQYTITAVKGSCLYTTDKVPQKTEHCFPAGTQLSGFLNADDRRSPQKAQWLQIGWQDKYATAAYQIPLRDLSPVRSSTPPAGAPAANAPTR